jgi:DNA-binding transcriptional LysR family regulator
MIDSNQLRCFVAVAEELHFGRAAARLNMTQPPLSRQIQILERVLGCLLLERSSRSVKLTQAGETLLSEAQVIMRLIEGAAVAVRDVAAGRRGIVRCGFTAAAAYQFLPALLGRLNVALPDVALTLKEMVSRRQIGGLDSGEIDVAFMRPPIDRSRFGSQLVFSEKLKLVHHVGHPLDGKDRIEWSDLDGLDMVMYEGYEAQYFHDLVVSHLSRNNTFPRYRQRVSQIHTILSLVRSRLGVAIVPESAALMDVVELRYRDLANGERLTADLFMVWPKESRNPLIPELARLASGAA